MTIGINLYSTDTGLTLSAQLVDTAGKALVTVERSRGARASVSALMGMGRTYGRGLWRSRRKQQA